MVYINKIAIENFISPLFSDIKDDPRNTVVSLFLISSKNQRLKALCLDHLSAEERQIKLHKWGLENRFVLVIEKGDQIFAHVQAQRAEALKNRDDLTVNDKKVTIQSLSEEDSALLTAICEDYEKFVEKNDEINTNSEETDQPSSLPFFSYSYLISLLGDSDSSRSPDSLKISFYHQMKKVIDNCLEKFKEARLEDQRRAEEEERKREVISKEIMRSELRFEIKMSEIKYQEISKKEKLLSTIKDEKGI